MSPAQIAGGLLGLTFAAGVILVWVRSPLWHRPDLADRIAPYLDQQPRPSRLLVAHSAGAPPLLLAPLLHRAGSALSRVLGGAESVTTRLHRAGLAPDVEAFRVRQALWGLASAAVVAGLGSMLWWSRGASIIALAVVVVCAFVGGVMLRDEMLSRAATRRERRILAEFPTIAELLALSVTAGEGTVQALERVTRLSKGELVGELELCLVQARTGASLTEALHGLSQRTGLSPIVRFVDGLVVAMQRGTPLGDVLRAQAADAREAARQALIEEGGRREISMMIPVVFLVLPVTVLFAVYPGATMLRIAL